MKIAIYGKQFNDEFKPAVEHLLDVLGELKIDVLIHETFYQFLTKALHRELPGERFRRNDELKSCHFMFSIGGDGTLLDTAQLVRDLGIPVLGVNTGRLGFLSHVDIDNAEKAIHSLVEREYSLDPRSLIHVAATGQDLGDFPYALNEVTVLNKERNSMITIHVKVNGHFMGTYWADGLIIATPTGSTAYSLSCGGPIVTPESNNLILTPIAPHNLNVRPFVISNNDTVELSMEARDSAILLSMDSRSYTIPTATELMLTRAHFDVSLVRLPGQDFFSTIRSKMGWATDKRN